VEGIDTRPATIRTNCWSVYSHFTGVDRWENVVAQLGGSTADYPFRCDDAALHHVMDEGWIWVLPFNNGVASAGMAFAGDRIPRSSPGRAVESEGAISPLSPWGRGVGGEGEAIWHSLLDRYPSLGRQFASARAVRPFTVTGRLQRCAQRAVGPNWAMLSHAAYFLDPFFSGGIAHSLLSIERLAEILDRHWERPTLAEQLKRYEAALFREVDYLDLLIHGCYHTFGRFPLFAAYSMYYFASAILSETRRRAGLAGPWSGFLSADWPGLGEAVERSHAELPSLTLNDADGFGQRIADDIAPFNTAGICDPLKKNLYPFV
jgi:FADH2 O2-dependent halogenase